MPIRGRFTAAAGVVIDNVVDVQLRTLRPAPGQASESGPAPAPQPVQFAASAVRKTL